MGKFFPQYILRRANISVIVSYILFTGDASVPYHWYRMKALDAVAYFGK